MLRTRVLQSCPQFLRGRYRHAQRIALEAIDEAIRAQNAQQEQRAWKLFGLLSALLLHRTHAAGRVGKQALEDRFAAFARGEWLALLEASKEYATGSFAGKRTSEEHARQARRNRAEAKVKLEECSKARQVLTQSELAPGTQATHDELTDPTRRPPELTEAIPNVVLQYSPDRPLEIKFMLFVESLRATARGSSGGPGGTTYPKDPCTPPRGTWRRGRHVMTCRLRETYERPTRDLREPAGMSRHGGPAAMYPWEV